MQKQLPGGNGHLNNDLKLNQIAYVGAHNCAMSKKYGWTYAQQNVTITEQFELYGARHFKVPLHWYLEGHNPEIAVAHEPDGRTNCKLTVMQRGFKKPEKANIRLKEIVDLSFQYPYEIIILKIESKLLCKSKRNGTKFWDPQLMSIMLHSLLVQIRADQRAIRIENEGEIPTLGWCRENQQTILICIEPIEQIFGELSKYTYYSYMLSAQVDWELNPLEDVQNGEVARGKKNQETGEILSPFLEIHYCPENSLKLDSSYRKKYNSYNHGRERFLQYYEKCKKLPNFLVADFIDQGRLSDIVDDINLIINSNGMFLPELFQIL
ncbi:unnamed protein product [Paramecium primaurelia]|uniref:Uncharacterized protein n=1 Tax=Paramecium primaurelia TaxID=5886 RepID=A0A8S1NE57_PARPR|nr:unnamed protein product [Paramecium primaurelia]